MRRFWTGSLCVLFGLACAGCPGGEGGGEGDSGHSVADGGDTAISDTVNGSDVEADGVANGGDATDAESWSPPHDMPELVGLSPKDGASDVPVTAWVVLEFEQRPQDVVDDDFQLTCDASSVDFEAIPLEDERVVVNPVAKLPATSPCEVAWQGPDGSERRRGFETAGSGKKATVLYDRNGGSVLAPFPDDVWTQKDSSSKTGLKVSFPKWDLSGNSNIALDILSKNLDVDGFSPIGSMVVELNDEPDESTLPTTADDTVGPLATVGLFNVDPKSKRYGERVPLYVRVKTAANTDGSKSPSLLLWAARPLEPAGQYGLVVTNRAAVATDRPYVKSDFYRKALDSPGTKNEKRAGSLSEQVLEALKETGSPIRKGDLAVATRFTVRTLDKIENSYLAVRKQVQNMNPPSYTVDSVVPETDPSSAVAAVVKGTWKAPDFADRSGWFVNRDMKGVPKNKGTQDAGFVIVLPDDAKNGPVPTLMVQHGHPDTADRLLPCYAREYVAEQGYAVVGFTSHAIRNLEIHPQKKPATKGVLNRFLTRHRYADGSYAGPIYFAEQLAFVRLLKQWKSLDVLPKGNTDGTNELNVDDLLYLGQSRGSGVGIPLMAYEPSFVAANLNASGGRRWSYILHPNAHETYQGTTNNFPKLSRAEFYVGLSIVQIWVDSVDPLIHARYIYREPFDLGAGGDRASILFGEGLDDPLVPIESTRTAAAAIGLPLIDPALEPDSYLKTASAPVQGNIDKNTTGAFVQFEVPESAPKKLACEGKTNGHQWCQGSKPAWKLHFEFFDSALNQQAPKVPDHTTLSP